MDIIKNEILRIMDHFRYRPGRIAAGLLAAILIIVVAAGAASVSTATEVSAAPIVIKGGSNEDENASDISDAAEETAGGNAAERDRSLQDGTLIYGLTPVYPEDILDGEYDADAVTSSQFFKITDVRLTKKGNELKAVIRISSTSYAYVYQGSAAEAAAAGESDWIPADESSGYGEFSIELEALNKEMPCAAYSKKKQKWYDRDVVILASSLPENALLTELSQDGGTIADTQQAAMKVIYIALAIIVAGGVLNHFIKKRYYE